MNDADGNILVLSEDALAGDLSRLAEGAKFAHRTEPYQMLEELARRRYDALVLAEGYPDLPALARAARRLNGRIRTFALCSPAGEAELRNLGLDGVDDYFIYPPSAEEMRHIFQPVPVGVYEPVTTEEPVSLPPGQVAALIDAASSPEDLAEQIRQLVSRWTGGETRWVDAAEGGEGGEPLLLLDAGGPRCLLAGGDQEVPPDARRKLQALQILAGPLAAQARRVELLHRLAITDHLTGAYNRRYFYHFTDQLLRRGRAEKFRVTLLLYDIDDFKRYNDAYGHAAGDEILRETVALMKKITREQDVVARIGGDEFTVLFWDAERPRRPDSRHPQTAQELTSRFVEALAEHKFPSLGREAQGVLTISGGLATFPWDGRDCRQLLRHADGALRRAKRSGKGAIYIVGESRPMNR